MIERECTDFFLHYREVARMIWNFGFYPNPRLREWDSLELYEEALARLFEALILHSLGYKARIEKSDSPGDAADFLVRAKRARMRLVVDGNVPGDAGHLWGHPTIDVNANGAPYELKFVKFFDWEQLGPRDFQFLEVLIVRLGERPELEGHHALIEPRECSIWLSEGADRETGAIT